MRIVCREKILEIRRKLDPVLIERFKKPVGLVDPTDKKKIDQRTANDYYYYFKQHFSRGSNYDGVAVLEKYNIKSTDLQKRLKEDAYGKKKKLSSILEIAHGNFGDNSKEGTRNFQKILAKWLAEFNEERFKYKIRWTLPAFDILGEIKNIDAQISCYHAGGQWSTSPSVLAAGLDGTIPTFVIFIFKPYIVARCWGAIRPEGIFITNGYYRSGFPNSISCFERAVKTAVGKDMKSIMNGFTWNYRLYTNGDQTLLTEDLDYKLPAEKKALREDHKNCIVCKKDDENAHQRGFCYTCLDYKRCVRCKKLVTEDLIDVDCRSCGQNKVCVPCYRTHKICDQCHRNGCRFFSVLNTKNRDLAKVCGYCTGYLFTCPTCASNVYEPKRQEIPNIRHGFCRCFSCRTDNVDLARAHLTEGQSEEIRRVEAIVYNEGLVPVEQPQEQRARNMWANIELGNVGHIWRADPNPPPRLVFRPARPAVPIRRIRPMPPEPEPDIDFGDEEYDEDDINE